MAIKYTRTLIHSHRHVAANAGDYPTTCNNLERFCTTHVDAKGPTLTVVQNNSRQQSFGCNLSFIIFSWSKCYLRSDSYKFGITLSASLVAVIIVGVVVDNFNPKTFFNARLWNSCVLHSSIESSKSPHTVRRMLLLLLYMTASRNLPSFAQPPQA